MKARINSMLKSKFIRNVIIMVSGTAGAQIITMGFSPIITRLYGPEAFGMLGTFNAMISIITPIAALTYPVAIVLPKKNQDAKGLIRLSLFVAFLISFLSIIVLYLFNDDIVKLFNLKDLSNYLYLIPLVIIIAGILETTQQWLIRTKQFTVSANVAITSSLIINGSKVGIGYFHPIATVLIMITVFGNALRSIMLILFSRKSKERIEPKDDFQTTSIIKLARDYYDFPLYRAPQIFLQAISEGLPVLFLAIFFGPSSAGFYTLGRSVLAVPINLIGKSVGNVFYPSIAEAANNNKNITKKIKQVTIGLSLAGVIPFGLVILFGPALFSFIFGNEWFIAGDYARWIAIGSFFQLISNPSIQTLPVLKAQKFNLIYSIIMLIVRTSALAIGYYVFASDTIAVALFGISTGVLFMILIIITLKKSENN